jgi:hypothetical protein
MEDAGIFYGHFDNFPAFGVFYGDLGIISPILVYFSPFWYVAPRKIWQPCTVTLFSFHLFYFYFASADREETAFLHLFTLPFYEPSPCVGKKLSNVI